MALAPNPPICLTDLRTEFGDANGGNVCLTEYYAGGANVAAGTSGTNGAVPSSGTVCLTDFLGTQAAVHTSQFNVFYKVHSGFGITNLYSGMWNEYPNSTTVGMFGTMSSPTFTGNYGGYNGTHTITQMQNIDTQASTVNSVVFEIHNGTGGTSSQSGGTAYSSNSGLTGIRVFNNSSYSGTPLIDLTFASASTTTNGWVSAAGSFGASIYYRGRQWSWGSTTLYPISTIFGTTNSTKYFQIY